MGLFVQRLRGRRPLKLMVFVVLALGAVAVFGRSAGACGGLFCQNDPVNQAGERIVFTVNGDGTVTSLIEIQYFGEAEDFSWILPMPSAITADDVAVPDEGDEVFPELHALTDVRIIAPEDPECARRERNASFEDDAASDSEESAGVEVFASGEVGPFGFDVIGSEDSSALIGWLRDNNYRVEPPMEPLINVYVEEQFAFLAMRLLDGQESDSIQPIEITYDADMPAIPLRLTAVAAQAEMPIWVWIFADSQAVPENFAHMEIATEELTFFAFGGNDYQSLVRSRADALNGQAFITEFAGASNSVELAHPYLQNLAREHSYITRLSTYISPEEMTVDPAFTLDPDRADVSNVRDATGMTGLYDCERDSGEEALITIGDTDAISPLDESGNIAAEPRTERVPRALPGWALALGVLAFVGLCFLAYWLLARRGQRPVLDEVSSR